LTQSLTPNNGRNISIDSQANDLWHCQTVIAVPNLTALADNLNSAPCKLVSPGIVEMYSNQLGFTKALAIKDLDGHILHFVEN
jgi:hypothetical protein